MVILARRGILEMEGEAREIQLDGVNRQRLFLSNMKTKSTDLREERKKKRKRKGERASEG